MTTPSQDNRVLLHILKHTPKDSEVYITWEGETFVGNITDIEVKRGVSIFTSFTIRGTLNS